MGAPRDSAAQPAGSCRRLLVCALEVHRRQILEGGMPTPRIVPALDELEHGGARFGWCAKPSLREQLALECREEALAHGIVVAVTDAAHGWSDAFLAATQPERDRRVLATLIGMVNHCSRTPLPHRHIQRVEDQFRPQVIRHRPANDAPTPD